MGAITSRTHLGGGLGLIGSRDPCTLNPISPKSLDLGLRIQGVDDSETNVFVSYRGLELRVLGGFRV